MELKPLSVKSCLGWPTDVWTEIRLWFFMCANIGQGRQTFVVGYTLLNETASQEGKNYGLSYQVNLK